MPGSRDGGREYKSAKLSGTRHQRRQMLSVYCSLFSFFRPAVFWFLHQLPMADHREACPPAAPEKKVFLSFLGFPCHRHQRFYTFFFLAAVLFHLKIFFPFFFISRWDDPPAGCMDGCTSPSLPRRWLCTRLKRRVIMLNLEKIRKDVLDPSRRL